MPPTTPIKLGIIGLSAAESSWAFRAHWPYFRNSTHYSIVALQNSSVASAQKAAAKYSLPAAACYDNINDLVADPNVDVVAVMIKVPDHYGMIAPALKAGKDVFTEWPIGRNVQEAEELTALAQKAGVRTMVGLQGRQDLAVRKAKEMVENGELGDILWSSMLGYGLDLGQSLLEERRYTLDIENGVNMITIAVGHSIDALCFVLGELRDLHASLGNGRRRMVLTDRGGNLVGEEEKTAHDGLAVSGRLLKGGGVVSVAYQSGVCQTGRGFRWEISGTKGTLLLEADNGFVQAAGPTIKFVKAEKGAELQEIQVERASEMAISPGKAWNAWAGEGVGGVVTFEDALVRHRMLDAIYRSDEKGTRETYI
jgi:predicted dehydrogenase